jgi:hypothetical protein
VSLLLTYARLAVSAAGAVALAALEPVPPRPRPAPTAYRPSPASRRLVQARVTGHPSASSVTGARAGAATVPGARLPGTAAATVDTSGPAPSRPQPMHPDKDRAITGRSIAAGDGQRLAS